MTRVAIVVVTYQSGEVVGACLDSLAGLAEAEVVVVDNASIDGTRAEVNRRGIRLIANAYNAGFAGAVNQGVRAASAPLVLLLNPDTCLETDLRSLVACFDDPRVAGAGGLLTGPDGLPQTGFMARNLPTPTALAFEVLGINRLWPGNPANWPYRCLGNDPMVPAFVEQPAGAFFIFRRSAWLEVGGFDESYWPVWFEDVDFCSRLRAAGYSVRYEPADRALHLGGHSTGRISLDIREKYWYGSLLKYAAKYFHPVAFGMICLSVAVGAAGRAAWQFPRGGLRVFAVYSSVIRLALSRLPRPRRGVRDV